MYFRINLLKPQKNKNISKEYRLKKKLKTGNEQI